MNLVLPGLAYSGYRCQFLLLPHLATFDIFINSALRHDLNEIMSPEDILAHYTCSTKRSTFPVMEFVFMALLCSWKLAL